MSHQPTMILLLVLVAWTGMSQGASAQRVPGFVRSSPVSPYVNLFRGNVGGLNSYFSLVRPQQDQARFNQQQQAQNMFLQQQLLNQQQLGGFGGGFGAGPMQMQQGALSRGGGAFMRGGNAGGGGALLGNGLGGIGGVGQVGGPIAGGVPRFPSAPASYFNYSHYYGVPVSGPATVRPITR